MSEVVVTSHRPALAGTTGQGSGRSIAAVLIVLTVAMALHPVTTDDLWWQLSRGRAVVDGHLAPSRFLLAGDSLNEADWLGGTPFYLASLFGGESALMLLKTLAVSGMVVWSWHTSRGLSTPLRLLLTTGLTMALQSACDPTPLLWELLGLAIAMFLVNRPGNELTSRDMASFGVLSVAWANLAPLSILILLPLATRFTRTLEPNTRRWSTRNTICLAAIALVGCSLTPRGPLTLWDSLRQLMPQLVEAPSVLRETPFRPVWETPLAGSVTGWSALMLLSLVCLARSGKARWREGWLLAIVLSLACWSQANAVVLSVWLWHWSVDCWRANSWDNPRWLSNRAAKLTAQATCLAVAGASALGIAPLSETRLGWGLDRRLEERTFADSLGTATETGTAHCTDLRSAGMLAWTEATRVKPFLVPRRALLNGRLRDEVLLNRELETGWLQRHQRTDGTAGGWWLTLQARETVLLLVSAERTALIRALEPTNWKPLSLDSPVIPYAIAGNPRFSPRMVRVLSQRDLIDRGEWSFQPEAASGNDRLLDGIGLLTGRSDIDSILRQAAVLRAMNLPQAAMRVLRPLLASDGIGPQVRHELIACQIELAEREWLTMGSVSEFRRLVFETLSIGEILRRIDPPDRSQPTDEQEAWAGDPRAAMLYLHGQPLAAARLLTSHQPAIMAARATLEWEAGRPMEARSLWTALKRQHPNSRYALASRQALEWDDY